MFWSLTTCEHTQITGRHICGYVCEPMCAIRRPSAQPLPPHCPQTPHKSRVHAMRYSAFSRSQIHSYVHMHTYMLHTTTTWQHKPNAYMCRRIDVKHSTLIAHAVPLPHLPTTPNPNFINSRRSTHVHIYHRKRSAQPFLFASLRLPIKRCAW